MSTWSWVGVVVCAAAAVTAWQVARSRVRTANQAWGSDLCWCGHGRDLHRHHRPGSDCSQCGATRCIAFRGATLAEHDRLLRGWMGE